MEPNNNTGETNDLEKNSQSYEEYLKYAPAYAYMEAFAAIIKVDKLQKSGLIKNGIYYIVLVDIVGSTKFSSKYGNEEINNRIEKFIKSGFKALNKAKIVNTAIFLKEIGDAVLFVFQNFQDILLWRYKLHKTLNKVKTKEPYVLRTCIHIGEIYLNGMNPISLAISDTFKMEKAIKGNDIGLTETAYNVAMPTIEKGSEGFEICNKIELYGYENPVNIYRLKLSEVDDLKAIIKNKKDE